MPGTLTFSTFQLMNVHLLYDRDSGYPRGLCICFKTEKQLGLREVGQLKEGHSMQLLSN